MSNNNTVSIALKLVGTEQLSSGLGQAAGNLQEFGKSAERSTGNYRQNMEKALSCTERLSARLESMQRFALSFVAFSKIASQLQSIIDAALKMDQLNAQFKVFTGSASLAAREIAFVREEANRLGLEMQGLTGSYATFLNAIKGTVNEGERGRKAFVGISEGMAAVGLSADAQNRAWTQLTQGIMKGKFEMQDLKAISEAGLPIYSLMADALGVNTSQLMEMQAKGQVLAADVLPKLGASMHAAFGTAAVEAADSAQGAINRARNAVFDVSATIGQLLLPMVAETARAASSFLTNNLEPIVSGFIRVQAELIRVAMLVDKLGGTLTALGRIMLKVAEITTRFVTVGQFGDGLAAGADKMKEWNKLYEERYKANEKQLYKLAELEQQLLNKDTNTDYTKFEKAQQALNQSMTAAATTAAGDQWASTYAALRKEVDLLGPVMTEHEKQIVQINEKYAELERKKGADIARLQELRQEHLLAAQTAYELSEAIKTTANEFAEYFRILGEETTAAQAAESMEDYLKGIRESIAAMNPAKKAAKDVADAVYDIGRAFEEADQAGAIDQFIENLFKLKELQEATDDIYISMADSDPATQQMAQIEERYRREKELIDEKMQALEQANLTETAAYKTLSDNLIAMAAQREKQIADIQRKESEAGWQSVVGAAQAAFPKLTGLDKAVSAAFADHTKYRLATEKERAAGANKIVKDETRTNLSMYGAYAGAAGAVFEGLAATQDTTSRSGFETAKAFNIAAAVMNTAMAITNALATVQPFPAAIAAAAMAGVMGAVQIATIASTQFGGAASSPALPTGSFAGGAGASVASGTIGSLRMGPVEYGVDSMSSDAVAGLAAAAKNASLAVGDLAASFKKASGAFEAGGAAYDVLDMMLGLRSGQITTTAKQYGEDPFMLAAWDALLHGYYDVLDKAAAGLGTSLTSHRYRTTYADLGGDNREQAAEYFRIYIGNLVSEYAKGMKGLINYAKPGELAADAAERLYNALYSVNKEFDSLGMKLLEGLQGADIASALTEAFELKGKDFVEALQSYASSMFSEAEQSAMELAQAEREFERGMQHVKTSQYSWISSVTNLMTGKSRIEYGFGQAAIPTTREEFRSLVAELSASLDDADKIVRQNAASSLASLLSLADAFGVMMDAADEAAEKVRKLAEAQLDLDRDVHARWLDVTGEVEAAKLYRLQVQQAKELQEAQEQGLNVTRLLEVQTLEYAQAMEEAAKTIETATQSILDAARKTLAETLTLTQSILGTLRQLLASGSQMTAEESYNQARRNWATADMGNAAQRGTELLTASKNYAGSAADYERDYRMVINRLAEYAEVTPELTAVEQQTELLKQIAKAVADGNDRLVEALGVTFEAAQIDMGRSKNSLTIAFEAIQAVFDTDFMPTAADTIQDAINHLQAALNNQNQPMTATAAAQAERAIASLQEKLNTSVTATAPAKIQTEIDRLQAALNTGVTGTAKDAINNSITLLQLALNGTITADTARAAIATTYQVVQGALDGTLSGTTAAFAIAAQAGIAQQALNGAISGADAKTRLEAQSNIVQQALDGAITAQTAEDKIKAEYSIVNDALGIGLSSALTLASVSLNSFFDAIIASAQAATNAMNDLTGNVGAVSPPPAPTYLKMGEMAMSASDFAIRTGTYDPTKAYKAIMVDAVWWKNTVTGQAKWLLASETPSFAVGSPYIPHDMLANIHQGEMVIDPATSDHLRRYGIQVHAPKAADNRELLAEIRELRAEVTALRQEQRIGHATIADNTGRAARKMDKFDKDGLNIRAAA